MILTRRLALIGLVAAPAIVKAASIMPVRVPPLVTLPIFETRHSVDGGRTYITTIQRNGAATAWMQMCSDGTTSAGGVHIPDFVPPNADILTRADYADGRVIFNDGRTVYLRQPGDLV